MMEHLPPVGWADVATKHDLDHLAEVVELRITAEGASLRTEIWQLRSDMQAAMTEFSRELGRELRSEMSMGLAEAEARMSARFDVLRAEQRQLMLLIVAGIVSTLGAVVGLR